MDTLASMRVFRKVVERESFSVAARQLGLSNASVSKHVAALEARLGTPLLTRTTRRVNLTESGRAYHDQLVRVLDELDAIEQTTSQRQTVPTGLLKVRAPVSMAYGQVGRMIGGFMARFPQVTVDLTLNDRFVDMSDEDFDVALVIGSNQKHAAHPIHATRVIAHMARELVATPAYLRRHGTPDSLQSLKQHNCVIYSRGQAPDEWHFVGAGGEDRMVRVHGTCRCNNSLLLRDVLLEGEGIGLLPSFVVADDLARRRLRRLLPDWTPAPRPVYVVHPRPREASPKVREFVEFMAAAFAADPQWTPAETATGAGSRNAPRSVRLRRRP